MVQIERADERPHYPLQRAALAPGEHETTLAEEVANRRGESCGDPDHAVDARILDVGSIAATPVAVRDVLDVVFQNAREQALIGTSCAGCRRLYTTWRPFTGRANAR